MTESLENPPTTEPGLLNTSPEANYFTEPGPYEQWSDQMAAVAEFAIKNNVEPPKDIY